MTEIVLLFVILILVAYIGYLHIVDSKERKEFITAFLAKDLRDKNDYEKGYPTRKIKDKKEDFIPLDSEDESIFDAHIKKVLEDGGENESDTESEQ